MSTTDNTLVTVDTDSFINGITANPNPKTEDFVTLFQALHVQGQPVRGAHGLLSSVVSPSYTPAAWKGKRTKIVKRLTKALTEFDAWLVARDAAEAKKRKAAAKAEEERAAAVKARRELAVSSLERVAKTGKGTEAVDAANSLLREYL